MIRTHKIRLVPTKTQRESLKLTAGAVRFTWNWALERWNDQYTNYKLGKAKSPNALELSRRWTQERPEWSKKFYRNAQTQAILNLGEAWTNFCQKNISGAPVFKKKRAKQSFYIDNAKPHLHGKEIQLPRIGYVKMRESLRFEGKVTGYTITSQAGEWYVSIHVNIPTENCVSKNNTTVGVDVGVMDLAVASDGTRLKNPKLQTLLSDKIRHLQRKLSRQKLGSNRRERTREKLQKLFKKTSDVRKDAIHKFTTALAKNHSLAVIETLDIEKLKQSPLIWMRRAMHDTAMSEVHRQLKYKMKVIQAPPYYRSSKTCSNCEQVKLVFPPSVRVYECENCGIVLDRDLNAAKNLELMRWVTASMLTEDLSVRRSEKRKRTIKS